MAEEEIEFCQRFGVESHAGSCSGSSAPGRRRRLNQWLLCNARGQVAIEQAQLVTAAPIVILYPFGPVGLALDVGLAHAQRVAAAG
jgi:hypothetical protein